MLDEEQGRGNCLILRLESDDMAVEEGLQIIVTMVFKAFLGKDGIYISKGLESSTTGSSPSGVVMLSKRSIIPPSVVVKVSLPTVI